MLRVLCILSLLLACLPCPLSGWSATCPKLSINAAQERITTLSEEIRHHNRLYYQQMNPEISDAAYDRLFAELVLMEECFPALVAADSPTRKVGGSIGVGVPTLPHERPMLSLSSTTGPEAVEILLRKVAAASGEATLLVQPKVDGLPVELIYSAGRLVSAATRGDGRTGEEVTDRVRKIQGIPLTLTGSFPVRVVVRGEVYADRRVLAASVERGEAQHATPRHYAAGTLLSRDTEAAALVALRIFPFELVNADQVAGVRTDREALHLMSEWGFPVGPDKTCAVENLDSVRAVYRNYLAGREQLPFAVDGIVVKVDNLELRRRLGEGSRAPFWAAAWKFPPDTARTVVRDIRWQVGKTGRRTPVAEVVPVSLGGVRVRRVSLHNDEEVTRLGIAAGAEVVVALAGDVIPQIVEVVGREPRGSEVAATAREQAQKPALDACLYDLPGCRDQFLSRARFFTSKRGVNIKGLGRGRLKLLIEAGLVKDLPSIFRLKYAEVAAVPGIGPQVARKVTESIRTVGRSEPFRLVAAIGIPGVGPATARRLATQFTSLERLLAADEQQMSSMPRNTADAVRTVRSFFKTPGGRELLREFRKLGFW